MTGGRAEMAGWQAGQENNWRQMMDDIDNDQLPGNWGDHFMTKKEEYVRVYLRTLGDYQQKQMMTSSTHIFDTLSQKQN